MMKNVTFEAKSLEEAKTQAETLLRVHRDYIDFDTTEKRGMFGFKKSYHVEATVNVDPATFGHNLLKTLFADMGIDAEINVETPNESEVRFHISTDANPVMIGKNGKTLDSLQVYMRNLLNIFTEERLIVFVDIGGYKENRRRQLEILATKTAKEVAKTKTAAKLDPMNAYERRIIHTKLADWRDVITKSEGERQKRYVVIKPKEK